MQDVVATIERFEQREKMKQERKDGGAGSHFLPASSHSSKKAGGSQSATPRLHSEKKRSLRLASTSSMSSISSIASPSSKREAKKSVTVVSPPKRANVSEVGFIKQCFILNVFVLKTGGIFRKMFHRLRKNVPASISNFHT